MSRKRAMNTISGAVKDFVVTNFLFGRNTELSDETSFLENGIVDSTGVLELVGFLEEHFGIVVADRELLPENLDSIRNVAQFVARKLEDSKERVG
jgi:acyl carrier protein